MHEVETAAGWRKKTMDVIVSILENGLGFKVPGDDYELLLAQNAQPEPAASPTPGGLDAASPAAFASRN